MPAVVSFLQDTKVGRITSKEIPREVKWEGLDEGIELWLGRMYQLGPGQLDGSKAPPRRQQGYAAGYK